MNIVNLFLPGKFEDASLYMGRLIVLTAERSLRFYNLESIICDLEKNYLSKSQPMLTYLFNRNDWLASTQFRLLLHNDQFLQVSLSALREATQIPYFELPSAQKHIQSEYELQIPGYVLLDMTVYSQRMYFAADSGFYHWDIDWYGDTAEPNDALRKRHDARSMNMSVGFGSVHVSCGDVGLFSAFDEFHWRTKETQRVLRQTSEQSFRTAWSGHDLINYATTTKPVLLSGHHEKVSVTDEEAERSLLTSIGEETIPLDSLLASVSTNGSTNTNPLRYVFNSNNTFFVHTFTGEFYTLSIGKHDHHLPDVKSKKIYKATNRILSIHPTSVGMVVETDDSIMLFANGQWHTIVDSAVLSVRTFIRSKRYKNVVAITTEEGVILSGLFDEAVNKATTTGV